MVGVVVHGVGVKKVVSGCVTLALGVAGAMVVIATSAPPAAAAEVKWRCSDAAYLFQSPNNQDPPHLVQSVDLVSGAYNTVGTTADLVNAVAYNTADDFMYAWNLRTDTLVRISADLTMTDLGVPASTPLAYRGVDYNVGDFDASGNLWIMDNQSGRWLRVDLSNPDAPATTASGIVAPPANLILPGDWAFIDGLFWAVAPMSPATSTQPARLVSFSPSSRTFTNRGILAGMVSGSTFGAVYSDDTYLYVSRNQGGNIYRVNPANTTNILLSHGPASSSNDGARCRSNIIPTVTISKHVAGRMQATDQFDVRLVEPSGTDAASVTTTGAQTTVTSINQPVVRGSTYVISDWLTPESPSLPSDYVGSLVCRTEAGAVSASPPVEIATWSLTIGLANDYHCTVTNTPNAPAPALELTKSVAPTDAGSFADGELLTYSFVVHNTGNVPVSDISVAEVAFSGSGTMTTPSCPPIVVLPRASITCTATYTVTAADVLAGTITNTARANGTDPGGGPVVSNDDSAEVPAAPAPALTIAKTAFPPVIVHAGEVVHYRFVVTNTGNIVVNNIAVSEDAFNGTGSPISTPVCDRTTLIPGQRALCTATYTATQADVDRDAPVANTAHATGTDPGGGGVVSPPDDARVPVYQNPELTLEKSARTAGDAAGDTVTYRFRVTNTGNTTVSGLTIAEESFSGTGAMGAASCPVTTLAPGAETTCTAAYTLTDADVDTGHLTNTAHSAGSDPQGAPVSSGPSSAVVGLSLPVRVPPRISTQTSHRRVTPGQAFHDRLRLRGLVKGTKVRATARLYGPFSSRAAARCTTAHRAKSVSWRAGNGWSSSPSVRVNTTGVYTWQVTTRSTSKNAPARHGCGVASETTTVAKAPYVAPTVDGGFAGTLLPGSSRATPPRILAPGIGLRAPVRTTTVSRGRMLLPGNVGQVAWLRRSAAYGDKIGTTIVAGHVSDRHDRPGAMTRLSQAKRGQVITVVIGGKAQRFEVTGKASYAKTSRIPQRYFRTTGRHRLVLISCTDRVVYQNRHFHYTKFQVVTARHLPARRR